MSRSLQLNCLLLDAHATANNIFPVDIPDTNSVDMLKEAIREERKLSYPHLAANTLRLWKVSIPDDDEDSELFISKLNELHLGDEAILLPTEILSSIFPDHPGPDEPESEHLHVIAIMPRLLQLNCFLLEAHGTANNIFPVKVHDAHSVDILKEAIRENCKYSYPHLAANTLRLWKVSMPVTSETFLSELRNLHLDDEAILLPTEILSSIFPDEPEHRHLHVIACLPFGDL